MELRYLDTQAQRQRFEIELTAARARGGIGFGESPRSRIGQVHLTFADLYGVFDEREDPDLMLAGFAMHALDVFGQSYPKPDLTHLPPETVFEVGELWSRSLGAGVSARWGCMILAGLLKAQSILIYPIVHPWDLTGAYPGFSKACPPVQWPFAQTADGRSILVQPMVAQGSGLAQLMSMVLCAGFLTSSNNHVIRFDNPLTTAMQIRHAMRNTRRRSVVRPGARPINGQDRLVEAVGLPAA